MVSIVQPCLLCFVFNYLAKRLQTVELWEIAAVTACTILFATVSKVEKRIRKQKKEHQKKPTPQHLSLA